MNGLEELSQVKRRMRTEARARRRALARAAEAPLWPRLEGHLLARIALPPEACIAGYWPIGDEFEVRPILGNFVQAGRRCALPVVAGPGRPLEFRQWRSDTVLEVAGFGVMEPPGSALILRPEVLLVPLLAFDRDGFRLGYGGGYYDRTLAGLRGDGQPPPLAIGVAYAGQELASVPHGPGDQRLDWIVTETGSHRCPPASGRED